MTNQGLDEGDSDEDAQDEEDVYQPKKYEYVALNPFKDLYKQSPLIQMSFEFGPSCIPLSAIGMILNYTGNHLLHFIYSVLGRRIFYPAHKVVSIQLMNNGDIITSVMRQEISIVLNDTNPNGEQLPAPPTLVDTNANGTNAIEPTDQQAQQPEKFTGPFKIIKHGETSVTFRSKAIVLSNGGQQAYHPEFFDWFPFMKERKDSLFLSDYMLQEKGYKEVLQRLKQPTSRKKIVIMGGSHSGFSAAWILLNGPADLLHNTHVTPTVQYTKKNTGKFTFPGAANRTIENCSRCCVCSYIPKKQRKNPCKCVCKCYGFFKYSDWGIDYDDLPKFEDADITILYRDRIRVFYSRVQQAQTEGYTDFKNLQFSNKNGFLYAFTGLRGDAKRMYKAIQNGTEKRVRLVKAPTPQDQTKYLQEADIVIWACGYQTNRIPVKDIDNKVIQMSAKVPFTQFDVDQRCRIITSDNGLLMKTFGTGLAYPVRTNDGMTIPESGKFNPRADGFSLYMNYVANTLLSNLLPKNRLMNKNHRTIRLQGKKTVAAQALQNERAQTMANSGANANNNNNAQAKVAGTSQNWVRSGSEQAPVHRSNTLARSSIQTKPPNVGNLQTSGGTASVNISKVHNTPAKVIPTKAALQTNTNSNTASVIQRPTQAYQNNNVSIQQQNDEILENGALPVPGYLQSNYITEQRKVAKESQMSPAPKKRSWVPSSKLGPAQNKIPKDTAKALELRLAAENTKQNQGGIVDCNKPIEQPAMQIQLQLSESGKAFQAVSQSYNMLKQQQVMVTNQTTQMMMHHSRYTLKTTEFANVFPNEITGGGIAYGSMGHHQQVPEFVKANNINYGATAHQQQSYGGSGAPITVASLFDKATASPEKISQIYSTPQKQSSVKTAHGASPLIYNHQSTLIENTPQVQKRKASFKMVKSVSKPDEFNSTFANPVLAEKRYSPSKVGWDSKDPKQSPSQTQQLFQQHQNQPQPLQQQHIVQSIETHGLNQAQNTSQNHHLHSLLSSQNSTKIQQHQQLQSQQNANLFKQQPTSTTVTSNTLNSQLHHGIQIGDSSAKQQPVSSQGPTNKRHPATANQNIASYSSPGKKKNSHSKHREKGSSNNTNQQQHQTGALSNSTNNTTLLSQSKSNSTSKSKRGGNFLKSCKTKFQVPQTSQSGINQTDQKTTSNLGNNSHNNENNSNMILNASPEKSLSHLASAGQRQIFSDESGSVSSAKRQQQLNERGSDMNVRLYSGHVTTTELNQSRQLALDKLSINQGGSNIISHTPKSLKKQIVATATQESGSKVQTSQQSRRNPSEVLKQEQSQLNAPLNGNFLTSEDIKSDQGQQLLLQQQQKEFQSFNDRALTEFHRNEPNSATDVNRSTIFRNKDSVLSYNGVDTGNIINKREMTLPVNSSSKVAHNQNNLFNVSIAPEVNNLPTGSSTKEQFSPQNTTGTRMPRSSSRQKSASRTHRSQSKGKAQQQSQHMELTSNHPKNIQQKDDQLKSEIKPTNLVSQGLKQGIKISNTAQMVTTLPQQKQIVTYTTTNGNQVAYSSPDMNARKSTSCYDARIIGQSQQSTTAQVPVKIFQLPPQGSQQTKAFTSAQFKHPQIISSQPVVNSPSTYIQQTQQLQQPPSMSPQPGGAIGGHKKSTLSQHAYYIQNSPQKVIQVIPSSQIISQQQHQRGLGGSTQTTKLGDPTAAKAVVLQSQTQIAQYGLMQVSQVQGQKTTTGASLANGSKVVQAYSNGQQTTQAAPGAHPSNGANLIVRKPVAASISVQSKVVASQQQQQQQQQQHQTQQQKMQMLQSQQIAAINSPAKLQYSQQHKSQLIPYQQSQQMHAALAASYGAKPGVGSYTNNPHQSPSPVKTVGVIQSQMQPKKFEINSPMVLKTKSGVIGPGGSSNTAYNGYLTVQKSQSMSTSQQQQQQLQQPQHQSQQLQLR